MINLPQVNITKILARKHRSYINIMADQLFELYLFERTAVYKNRRGKSLRENTSQIIYLLMSEFNQVTKETHNV